MFESFAERKEKAITVMLLAVVALFLVCNSLAFINNFLDIFIVVLQENEPPTWFTSSVEVSRSYFAIERAVHFFLNF